jgi:hypothetical protein
MAPDTGLTEGMDWKTGQVKFPQAPIPAALAKATGMSGEAARQIVGMLGLSMRAWNPQDLEEQTAKREQEAALTTLRTRLDEAIKAGRLNEYLADFKRAVEAVRQKSPDAMRPAKIPEAVKQGMFP